MPLVPTHHITSLCEGRLVTEELSPIIMLLMHQWLGVMRAAFGSCPESLGAAGLAVAEHVTCLLEGRCCTLLSGEHRERRRWNFKKSQNPVIYLSYLLLVLVSQRGGQLREAEASDNSHFRLEILLDRKITSLCKDERMGSSLVPLLSHRALEICTARREGACGKWTPTLFAQNKS